MNDMRRRDRSGDDDRGENAPGEPGFNSPFRDLGKLVGPLPSTAPRPLARHAKVASPAPTRLTAKVPPVDEQALFQAAVSGAVPIPREERNRSVAPPSRPASPVMSDELAVLAELNDLVSGAAAFDVSDTEEHVEGMVVGLDPRILRRLRGGELAYQAHLDLHGMKTDEAKAAVQAFVLRSMSLGHRCVLLVHGRGRNSPDQRSVLKEGVKRWLTRGELGRRVLAFSTARPHDGGSGATYVLLRRERRGKKPFQTLVGAKS